MDQEIHEKNRPACPWRSPSEVTSTPPPQLPASFFAYRKQQHRWTCGPIQLWAKASADVWASQLPLPRKLELVLLYFGVRKCATHLVSLGFFCTLVPLTVFTPEVGGDRGVRDAGRCPLVYLPVGPARCGARQAGSMPRARACTVARHPPA